MDKKTQMTMVKLYLELYFNNPEKLDKSIHDSMKKFFVESQDTEMLNFVNLKYIEHHTMEDVADCMFCSLTTAYRVYKDLVEEIRFTIKDYL